MKSLKISYKMQIMISRYFLLTLDEMLQEIDNHLSNKTLNSTLFPDTVDIQLLSYKY